MGLMFNFPAATGGVTAYWRDSSNVMEMAWSLDRFKQMMLSGRGSLVLGNMSGWLRRQRQR